jgi:hypothetical protein
MGKIGVLYEDQRFKTLHGATYNIREMGRRLAMVLVILFFNKMPYFQIVFLTILSFMTMWMLMKDNAFTTKNKNKTEFLNEWLVYSSSWISMTF